MVPTLVKLPGQSRSMVQLLPPPSDLDNPLTAVELARSAEVSSACFIVGVSSSTSRLLLAAALPPPCASSTCSFLQRPEHKKWTRNKLTTLSMTMAACVLKLRELYSHPVWNSPAGVVAGPARRRKSKSSGCSRAQQLGSPALDGSASAASASARTGAGFAQGPGCCQEESACCCGITGAHTDSSDTEQSLCCLLHLPACRRAPSCEQCH